MGTIARKLVGPNHPALTTNCAFTDIVTAQRTARALRKFIYQRECFGVSANQLGIIDRVCVTRYEGVTRDWIDPMIVKVGFKEVVSKAEGCMSYNDNKKNPLRIDIERYEEITISYIVNWFGKVSRFEEILTGTMAIVLQHELDHLNGAPQHLEKFETYTLKKG